MSEQPGTVFPVFLKDREKDKRYRYIGDYQSKLHSLINDHQHIQEAESKSGRHGQLSYLFDLLEVN